MRRVTAILLVALMGCDDASPAPAPTTAATMAPDGSIDDKVATVGSLEVTARLVEVPQGAIFRRELYNYATVLKYQVQIVHRGAIPPDATIYVCHYNPFKPRSEAADKFVTGIGGDVRGFRAGDVQRIAMEASVDDHFMGGLVNKYFGVDTGPLYWAVWTNRVRR